MDRIREEWEEWAGKFMSGRMFLSEDRRLKGASGRTKTARACQGGKMRIPLSMIFIEIILLDV
jgi:hypothetical protein